MSHDPADHTSHEASSTRTHLATSPEILSSAFEFAPDAKLLVDSDGRIMRVNAQAEQLFGYAREELAGRHIELLIPERFAGRHVDYRSGYMATPRLRPMGAGVDLFARRKDGSEVPVDIMLSPLQTQEGSLALAVVRDITERKRAEEKFRSLLESAPDAMVIVDARGAIMLVNSQTEHMFGYPRQELLGRPVEILIPARFHEQHPHHREGYAAHSRVRPMGVGLELFGLRKDGTEFPVEISLGPLQTEEGMLVSSAIRDITERKKAEATARQAREMYLRELHHRVKNNLQVISSMLYLQARHAKDPEALEILRESRGRVRSIAMIHEKLNRDPELRTINFADYMRDLVADLTRTYAADPNRILVTVSAEDLTFEIDTAIPCGLIINELVSNVFKHAFPEGRSGQVNISLERADTDEYRLVVRDDGIGLPKDSDWRTGSSLGLALVTDLTRQLDGAMEVDVDRGTTFRIAFKEVRYKERS
jgi:PAS domain S-box-containing protein